MKILTIIILAITTSLFASTEKDLWTRLYNMHKEDAGMPAFYKLRNEVSNWRLYMRDLMKQDINKAKNLVNQIEAEHIKFKEELAVKREKENICKIDIKDFDNLTEEDLNNLTTKTQILKIFRVLKCR